MIACKKKTVRPFLELRFLIAQNGMTMKELAATLGCSASHFSLRVNGSYPFSMNEVYQICDLFQVPYESIARYFPPIK